MIIWKEAQRTCPNLPETFSNHKMKNNSKIAKGKYFGQAGEKKTKKKSGFSTV